MKMKNEFKSYFGSNINNGNEKLTIVLGSGFHKVNSIKVNNVLSSWELLLQSLDPKFISQGNYLLDFERMIIKHSTNLPAQQVETTKLSSVAQFIKEEQEKFGAEDLKQYPIDIFNPDFVSDVIILNFDSLAEKICQEVMGCKLSTFQYVEIDKELKKEAKIHQTTRFKNVFFPGKGSIRFWYPHGSISKPTEMILSARSYATHIANIEKLRKHSKSNERTEKTKNATWYDKLTHQPVLILGASISAAEWDLWSAFISRERNFSKPENRKHRKPIFQMRSNQSEDSKKKCDQSNETWFEPLFDENLPFDKQWEMLKKFFSV